MRWLVRGYRIAFAVLAAVALGRQAHLVVGQGRGLVDFFSYFTIESNILGVLVLAWGGIRGRVSDQVRGAVVVYLAITGVVYAVLLADVPGQHIEPWVNTVVHQVMPIVVVADWLLVPPRDRLPQVWWWLVFPLVYLAYSLVRGPFAHWYPYPFLDPRASGYGHVVVSAVGIAVAFVVVTLLVRWVGGRLARRV